MENLIIHELKIKKIQEMKNPVILMNDTDFENFKKEVESKTTNLKPGLNPTYEGIPIKTNEFTKKGSVIIYDDIFYQ